LFALFPSYRAVLLKLLLGQLTRTHSFSVFSAVITIHHTIAKNYILRPTFADLSQLV